MSDIFQKIIDSDSTEQSASLLVEDSVGVNMTVRKKLQCQYYVEGLLMGLTKGEAAVFSGYNGKQATGYGAKLFRQPYVQFLLQKTYRAIEANQIVTAQEVILGLKREANNHEDGDARTRLIALGSLARILGLFDNPINKPAETVDNSQVLVYIPDNNRDGASDAAES